MKQTFLVTVSVDDDCSPADVAKELEKLITSVENNPCQLVVSEVRPETDLPPQALSYQRIQDELSNQRASGEKRNIKFSITPDVIKGLFNSMVRAVHHDSGDPSLGCSSTDSTKSQVLFDLIAMLLNDYILRNALK